MSGYQDYLYNPAANQGLNIQTSYQPTTIYPDSYTQAAKNWADSMATPSASRAITGNQQQGVSVRSPSLQYNTGISLAQALSNAMTAPSQVGMTQGFANANNLLTGEVGRSNEALGWGQLGAQQMANQYQLDQSQTNSLLSFLRQLMGSGGYF